MKRTALVLALVSILLFLVVGVFFVNLVKGNAIFYDGYIDMKTKPVYHSSTITLNYDAVFPSFGDGGLGRKWIVYSLDGGRNVTIYDEYNGLESYNGSLTLSGLSSGRHTIDMYSRHGTFVSMYLTGYSYWDDAHDRDSFSIELSEKSPSPTPTATPEPTPFEETGVQSTSQFMVAGGAVALVSIIVFLGLLVYLMKRK